MCFLFVFALLSAIFFGVEVEREVVPSLAQSLPLVTSSIPVEACDPLFMLVVEITTDAGMLVAFGMVPLLPHGKVAIQVDVVQTSPFGYDSTTTVNHATIVDYTTCDVSREVYLVCTDKRCIIRNISL